METTHTDLRPAASAPGGGAKPRSAEIDAIRGVLIALVVAGHMIQYFVYRNGSVWFDPIFKGIYMFHMPLFMAISGYLAYSGITRSPKNFVPRRAAQILVPLLVWIAVRTVVFIGVGLQGFPTPLEFIVAALSSYWFLWVVFASGALIAALRAIGRDSPFAFLVVAALLLLLPDSASGAQLPLQMKFEYPFFAAGYLIAKHGSFPRLREIWLYAALLPTLVVCFVLWHLDTYIYVGGFHVAQKPEIITILIVAFRWFASAVACASVYWLLWLAFRRRVPELLVYLGRASIAIYLTQEPLMDFLIARGYFERIGGRTVVRYLEMPIVSGLMILVSVGLYYAISRVRPLSKYAFGR